MVAILCQTSFWRLMRTICPDRAVGRRNHNRIKRIIAPFSIIVLTTTATITPIRGRKSRVHFTVDFDQFVLATFWEAFFFWTSLGALFFSPRKTSTAAATVVTGGDIVKKTTESLLRSKEKCLKQWRLADWTAIPKKAIRKNRTGVTLSRLLLPFASFFWPLFTGT